MASACQPGCSSHRTPAAAPVGRERAHARRPGGSLRNALQSPRAVARLQRQGGWRRCGRRSNLWLPLVLIFAPSPSSSTRSALATRPGERRAPRMVGQVCFRTGGKKFRARPPSPVRHAESRALALVDGDPIQRVALRATWPGSTSRHLRLMRRRPRLDPSSEGENANWRPHRQVKTTGCTCHKEEIHESGIGSHHWP